MLKQRPLDSKTVLFHFIVPHQGCHSLRTFPGGRQLQAHLYLLYHLPWSEKIHHTFVLITCKRDLLINNKDILKSTAGINSTVYNVQCHAKQLQTEKLPCIYMYKYSTVHGLMK